MLGTSRNKGRAYNWHAYKCSRRPCATPGCPNKTQTADPRCSFCRQGHKGHLHAQAQDVRAA